MGLLTSILTLPYAPVRMVTALGRVLQEQAETELYGSTNVRRELEGLDEAVAAGEISEDERAEAEQAILDRLVAPSEPGTSPVPLPGPSPEPPDQKVR